MLIEYKSSSGEFICYALPGECKLAESAGFSRRKNNVYYTRNFSIARSMLFWTHGKTSEMLLNWSPKPNNETRNIAVADPPVGLKYLPHQPEGIRFCLDRKRVLLADQMRVGKMIQISGYIKSLVEHGSFNRFLVVMPAKMVTTAKKALELWIGEPCHIVDRKCKPDGNGIYITSYRKLSIKTYLHYFKNWSPDVIVADEAHLIKNEFSKRTITLKDMCLQADKVLFVTGTPAPNGLKETFYMLNILDEERFSTYISHEKNVLKHINEVMIRRTRAEVFGMPEKSRRFVYLSQQGISRHIRNELKAYKDWGDRKIIEFSDFSRARREAAIKKVSAIKGYIDEQLPIILSNNEKLLIGCYHLSVMNQLVEHIKEKHCNGVVLINGETSAKEDEQSMDMFNNDNNCKVMVCSQRSVLGKTFTAANNVLVAELDYVPANIEQFEDRVFHFASSERTINIDYLIVEDSFDQHMMKTLIQKNMDIERVFTEAY